MWRAKVIMEHIKQDIVEVIVLTLMLRNYLKFQWSCRITVLGFKTMEVITNGSLNYVDPAICLKLCAGCHVCAFTIFTALLRHYAH